MERNRKTEQELHDAWVRGDSEDPKEPKPQPQKRMTADDLLGERMKKEEERQYKEWLEGNPVPPKAKKPSKEKPQSEWKIVYEDENHILREEVPPKNPYLRAIEEFDEKQRKEDELKKAREELEKLNKKAG